MSTTTLVTFQEFEQLPDAPGKRELIDGEVIEIPLPKVSHALVSKRLFLLLAATTVGERAFHEGGYRLHEGWVQPDVSVTHPDQPIEDGYYMGTPALTVEVLSPSNTAAQIDRKLTLYFVEGADEVWVIDPRKRTLTVYRQVGDNVHRVSVQERYTSSGLGITITLDQLFG